MTLSQRAIEAAARAISDADGSGWDTILGKRECERNRYRTLAASALTAALAVDGVALVPKEPTTDIIDAGCIAWLDRRGQDYKNFSESTFGELLADAYRAMIATAANDGEERR